ncbi:Crp/Fnr family transcriptional regulator [Niabella aurantiaca]|uniref:Crp/Fnr family transcriptional regulator n=1 Tax=Niabella aurantiaca TaxID=379900 RepID=UPI00036AC5CD|nr:Crp/Fnr family transcriptional regulator [Niabella aurantiaca]
MQADPNPEYVTRFKKAISDYYTISENTFALLEQFIQFRKFKKDDILLHSGRLGNDIHFICKGALRSYFIDKAGNTWNKYIYLENDFASTRFSLILRVPTEYMLQAIEDTVSLCLPYLKTKAAVSRNDELKNLYIAYLEQKWIVDNEQREISLLTETATERYLKLLQAHPGIEKRIPLQYIASHLSITPTQLSRIRKELGTI